ncbi:MAG: ABC transporter, partial [Mesorhizobium sp.]
MNMLPVNRRLLIKAMLLGSAAPLLASSVALASSCGDQIVRMAAIWAADTMNPFATW